MRTRTAIVVRDDEGSVNGGGRLVENKNGNCCVRDDEGTVLVLVRTRTAIVVSVMTRGR